MAGPQSRRRFLGTAAGAAAAVALRPRHHRTAAQAQVAGAGGNVPVTVVNTGSFNGGGVLPPGVTLRAIDGGPTFYADHGWTYAATAGWDSPSFFPIGLFEPPMVVQADADRWHDLGLNTAFNITDNSSLALMRSNSLWLWLNAGGGTSPLLVGGAGLGSESVGLQAADEPSVMTDWTSSLSNISNADQDHRPWYLNNTWNFVAFGGISPVGSSAQVLTTQVATPNSTLRSLSVQSVDLYWFASVPAGGNTEGQGIYNLSSPMPADNVARGCRYGDMVGFLRAFETLNADGSGVMPILQFVEDGGPYTQDTTAATYITPAQLNSGVWSSVIHGARMICYFNHSFAGPAGSDDNLAQSYYQTVQSGQSVSIYAQVKGTNTLVANLAPVINSPFALGYVNVSPPATVISQTTPDGGIDVMAKHYTGGAFSNAAGSFGNGFYIFAQPRTSQTATNISATFTVAGGYSGPVHAINADGGNATYGTAYTLTATSGVFTDTLATGASVRIYQMG